MPLGISQGFGLARLWFSVVVQVEIDGCLGKTLAGIRGFIFIQVAKGSSGDGCGGRKIGDSEIRCR